MIKSILQLILDFALEPALLDAIGAFFLFFLYFRLVARYSVIKATGFSVLGYGFSFLMLVAGLASAAATGQRWLFYAGFAGVFVVGLVLTRKHGLIPALGWGLALLAISWLTDTFITAAILFE